MKPKTHVQTLIFPKAQFASALLVRLWILRDDKGRFKVDKIDETAKSYRVRQREPSAFVPGSFRTIKLGRGGVEAVVGHLR